MSCVTLFSSSTKQDYRPQANPCASPHSRTEGHRARRSCSLVHYLATRAAIGIVHRRISRGRIPTEQHSVGLGMMIAGDSESCPSLDVRPAVMPVVCEKERSGAYSGWAHRSMVYGKVVFIMDDQQRQLLDGFPQNPSANLPRLADMLRRAGTTTQVSEATIARDCCDISIISAHVGLLQYTLSLRSCELVPYYHANAAHVHVCLPQIAGAPVIGSRGSGSSLIGLAADNAAPWYLICTCATYCLLESFLGSSLVSNDCVY